MANSILKSHVLRSRNHPKYPWKYPKSSDASLCSRRSSSILGFPVCYHRFPVPSHSVPLPPPFLLDSSPFPALLRRRLPHLVSTMSSSVNSSQDSDVPAISDPAAKTVRVVIKGRVQGVFYRNWTIENAQELGLKGWVRNRRDGSVEALFSGSQEKVDEMEQRCRRGPPDAMVTSLQLFQTAESEIPDLGAMFELNAGGQRHG